MDTSSALFNFIGGLITLGLFSIIPIMIFRSLRRAAKKSEPFTFEGAVPPRESSRTFLCPKCNGTMEEGYLLARSGIFWTPQGERFTYRRSFADALPNTSNLGWGGRKRCNNAWKCPQCTLVVIDHSRIYETSKPQ